MSAPQSLETVVDPADDKGAVLVRSPGVGIYGSAPRLGEILVGGSRVGRLTTLGSAVDLVLPAGATGRVAETVLTHRREPVEFAQVLLRLTPVEATGIDDPVPDAAQEARDDLPTGTFAVTSPTHGVFYRRPTPDAPPFAEEGQVVERGATMALVEVMKCFTAIAYGGQGLPHRAEVVEIRASDGAEVGADQILFVVRPV
jgi:acetyl-CoA carboxylase biotin carboxyl carrier protein